MISDSMTSGGRNFMDENFLLTTPASRYLYHHVSRPQPIIDFHCHLSPREIADDRPFSSITELWLGGDHYKWRAMRANGVEEKYITGDAPDIEKFRKWADTLAHAFRNPLYHWSHLELKRAFGIDKVLNPETADEIYEECNERLRDSDMTPRGLIRKFNVEAICTTDDPADSLIHHQKIAGLKFETRVVPAWRPDKVLAFDDYPAYRKYIAALSESSDVDINNYQSLFDALRLRQDFFHQNGCRMADHGLSSIPYAECSEFEKERLFDDLMSGVRLGAEGSEQLRTSMLLDLLRMNHEKDWAQQLHFGPLRNVNAKMWKRLGADAGYDTIGDAGGAQKLSSLLNELDASDSLARTILYNLNPADNAWVAAMAGNFQTGPEPGKMQMGAAWWFNDHLGGMRRQIDAISEQGLLIRFVGMLTDSRSFLSYTRHEYFRRLLCQIIGDDLENGFIPYSELPRAEQMVADISYHNAKSYCKV